MTTLSIVTQAHSEAVEYSPAFRKFPERGAVAKQAGMRRRGWGKAIFSYT